MGATQLRNASVQSRSGGPEVILKTVRVTSTSRFDGAMDINAAMSVDGVLTMESGKQLLADPGTQAAPGIAFRGATGYGMRQSSISCILVTAGADRFTYNSGGGSFAGLLQLTGAGAYVEFPQITEPAAPSAGVTRVYGVDNGASKTQLRARFDSGASQPIATEP